MTVRPSLGRNSGILYQLYYPNYTLGRMAVFRKFKNGGKLVECLLDLGKAEALSPTQQPEGVGMVSTMSKTRNDGKTDGKPTKKNLNVAMDDGERIAKIAALRGQTIEEFFASEEIRNYFKHLLVAEAKREAKNQQGQN